MIRRLLVQGELAHHRRAAGIPKIMCSCALWLTDVHGGQVARARKLQKNSTEAERRLWYALRPLKPHGIHFRRQVPLGPYFPDFVCHRSKIVIELDGSQHADEPVAEYAAQRTAFLNARGYRVLRFWNSDVIENRNSVVEIILAAAKPPPARRPPRVGGGE